MCGCVCVYAFDRLCFYWMDCVQPTLRAKQRRVVYPTRLYRHSNAAQWAHNENSHSNTHTHTHKHTNTQNTDMVVTWFVALALFDRKCVWLALTVHDKGNWRHWRQRVGIGHACVCACMRSVPEERQVLVDVTCSHGRVSHVACVSLYRAKHRWQCLLVCSFIWRHIE